MAKRRSRKKTRYVFLPFSKRKMSPEQEFDVMKMVLDKFLWLGFIIMAFGLYMMIRSSELAYKGFTLIVAGGIILLLFTILIVKEFEVIRAGEQ